jgi:hypothetical protein
VANALDGKPVIQFDAVISAIAGYTSPTITTMSQPYTVMLICRKDGGDISIRALFSGTGPVGSQLSIRYPGNITDVQLLAFTSIQTATDQTTYAQFTFKADGASSSIRRKGTELFAGNAGTNPVAGTLVLGLHQAGSYCHNGPMAFAAIGVLTDAQRDYIENLLNTKYYPSTVA